MSVSMYDVAVPLFERILESLKAMLDKAWPPTPGPPATTRRCCSRRGSSPTCGRSASRLPLSTAFGARGVARLAGVDVPSLPEALDTFADLHARLDQTLAFVRGADKAAVDAGATREVTVPWGPEQKTMTTAPLFPDASPCPTSCSARHRCASRTSLRHNGGGLLLAEVDFAADLKSLPGISHGCVRTAHVIDAMLNRHRASLGRRASNS